jgi:hypothetical protein
MRNQLFFAAVVVFLAGCGEPAKIQQESAVNKAVKAISDFKPNLSSPDFAVKSWWQAKDLQRNLAGSYCLDNNIIESDKVASGKLKEIASEDLPFERDCNPDVTRFERNITRVDVQSETRAVVSAVIKNASAPESGAHLTTAAESRKDAGSPFRYILTRKDKSNGWRVESVEQMPSWKNTWEKVYTRREPSDNSYVYDRYQ